ncbi:MAG: ATP-binding protein [bacterium]
MKFNLNKIVHLHIRGKLAIAFTGLSVLPVLVVGILWISTNVRMLHQVAIESLKHDLLTIKERLSTFIYGMEENIAFITASASFQNFIQTAASGDQTEMVVAVENFAPDVISFARRKQIFYQIKYLDAEGTEIFIVEHDFQNYRLLPPEELNRTGTSFYSHLAREIPTNKATFIPVELMHRAHKTLLPSISCVYPIYHHEFAGLLIFQIYAQTFFKIMELQSPRGSSGTTMLVNSDGYYLYHSKKKKMWNQLLATKDVLNLTTEYGQQFAHKLLTNSSESFYEINGSIVAHLPIFSKYGGLEGEYTILKSVSKKEIFAPAEKFKKLFFALLGLFLIISLQLAYLATKQFTGPIEKLTREAEVIAQGDYRSRVDVQTFDEIGELASQFNVMAESLEQRETEIVQHRERLEDMVRDRTSELEKEKNKLQAILDNVPSGFVLLDKDYTILTASAAMKSLAGCATDELLGRPCFEVFGNERPCRDCPSHEVFASGRMQSQVLQRLNSEGEERFWEHISVPLKKAQRVENILEIITDVTERKRLQDQLIRSERLAATGEMAAVIAHEMRNSLTSVRMLLQLFTENESSVHYDRESFDVALDSLTRMERVVQDLLQLARPAQLKKQVRSINSILQESVEFASHQIVSKGIELRVDLASNLPRVELDVEHFKEALINMILNASQAIDNGGSIHLRTELKRLKKNYRDLGEVRIAEGKNASVKVREVQLKKGLQVIGVQIKDTGCGIPADHLKRIFDPFFTTKTNGTGLGLSFVKRVVNEHDGLILAESKVGKGSCFEIVIPVS